MNHRKNELLERARGHVASDILRKGTFGDYAEGFCGCSIGCHLHDIVTGREAFAAVAQPCRVVAEYYGYPEWLAQFQCYIFEKLPDEVGRAFHIDIAAAIAVCPAEVDWQTALHLFHVDVLRMVMLSAGVAEQVVSHVIELHRRALTQAVDEREWVTAEVAARSFMRSLEWDPQDYATWKTIAAAMAAQAAAGSASWPDEYDAARSAAESVRLSAIWFDRWTIDPSDVAAAALRAIADISQRDGDP
ncbi:MAG: hypothetical protein KGI75_00920 [Rhizobiaceae bacterium]|nr:hypothetical protein [Rhizobiaceae bacterium]